MISRADCKILYPENPVIEKKLSSKKTALPFRCTVPCASYDICQNQLDEIFSQVSNCNPDYIFVFGHLKQGKINFDDPYKIYTNEDCPVINNLLEKDDEVCSEEFCAEILLPYCDVYFPYAKVIQFLSNDFSPMTEEFIKSLESEYPNALFFISDY